MDQTWTSAATAAAGTRDSQTVSAGGVRATAPKIAGVQVVELGNVLTRSGSLLELFRQDWPSIAIAVASAATSGWRFGTAASPRRLMVRARSSGWARCDR
jgi:hypothetical protein